MKRAIFFIDGFNLYHSLVNPQNHYKLYRYKWLNLRKLVKLFLQKQDALVDIYYFSAICTWNQNKANKHRIYIRALRNENIKIVLGKFKQVTKKCLAACKQNYLTHEEKRTDVNIAIHLLSLAPEYDIAYVISADSDLIPAIEEVKKLYPSKEIVVIIPFDKMAEELKSVCHSHMRIKEKHIVTSQFNKSITLQDGTIITCPIEWIT